jgi:hypothetical protein
VYALEANEGLRLADIAARCAMPEAEGGLGIGPVSHTALSDFLREWRTCAWRERLQAAAETAREAVDQEIIAGGAHMDDAILAGIREWILDTLARGQMDPRDAKGLVGLILKDRQQGLDSRKVALLEQKAALVDELKKKSQERGGLTTDDITEIERRLKLL